MVKKSSIILIALLLVFLTAGCVSDTHGRYATYVNHSDYVELEYPANWTVDEYYLNKTMFYPPINSTTNDYDFHVCLNYHSTTNDSAYGMTPFTSEDMRRMVIEHYLSPYETNVKVLNVENTSLNGLPAFEFLYTNAPKKCILVTGFAGNYRYYDPLMGGTYYVLKEYSIEYVANEYVFDVHIDEFKHMISTFKIIT